MGRSCRLYFSLVLSNTSAGIWMSYLFTLKSNSGWPVDILNQRDSVSHFMENQPDAAKQANSSLPYAVTAPFLMLCPTQQQPFCLKFYNGNAEKHIEDFNASKPAALGK